MDGLIGMSKNAKVYSYLRFSDAKQSAGSSADRQSQYAERWARERGLVLDQALSLRDEGLSAYHQRHIKQGALGVFLRAIDEGKIAPGSFLVVEGLDRLSRTAPLSAQAQLAQVVNAGITVVTASDGKEYSREGLTANPMDLIYSLLVMIRAHEESDTKSKRVRAAIRRQCDGWQAGTFRGVIRNGKDPQWVRLVDGAWEFVPERLEAVRLAIRLFLDGHGAAKIIDRLNDAGLAVSARTAASNLYKLLRLPALVGAKTLNVGDSEYRLEGYYPRVLTDEAFTDLQVALTQRGRRKGKGEIPGIITGLRVSYCGYCGSAMVGQNLTSRRRDDRGKVLDGHRRIACCSDQAGRRCPVKGGSTSVAPIERALLTYCADQINLNALLDRTAQDGPARQHVATARAKEAECERKLQRLTDVLLQDDEAPPPTLLRQIRNIEAELVSVRGTLSAAEGELSMLSRKTPAAAQAWAELVEAVKSQDYDARLKARQLVADTFSRIVVYRRGIHLDSDESGKVLDLVIIPHGGAARVLRVNRKSGEWIAGEDVSLDQPLD
ncbi:recombinase family protein [Luteibacter mycovicinus]|uniref:recombinase family protein n=1 Tax=Luteibacter mycovicinus TaxID=1500890 RepID=UPI001EFDBE70|nr:recombinase family protein [Luteibacter sp. 9143a]